MYFALSTPNFLFLFLIDKYKTVAIKLNEANRIIVIIGLTRSRPPNKTTKSAKSAISATDVARIPTVILSTPVTNE